jgi:hypothetical protein
MAAAAVIPWITAFTAAVGTGFSIYQGIEGKKMQEQGLADQEEATRKAEQNAQKQLTATEMASNKANAQSADAGSIMSQAQQAAKSGPAGTMITGPQGVNPAALSLGKQSVLGG